MKSQICMLWHLRYRQHISEFSVWILLISIIESHWITTLNDNYFLGDNLNHPVADLTAYSEPVLTQWGRMTHICVGKLTIISSDNGLSPGRRQAIIQTNAGILLIGPLGTNFSEILSEIHIFSFKKVHLKLSSAKLRPFGFGLNVLT